MKLLAEVEKWLKLPQITVTFCLEGIMTEPLIYWAFWYLLLKRRRVVLLEHIPFAHTKFIDVWGGGATTSRSLSG